jgi:hypothetical protein
MGPPSEKGEKNRNIPETGRLSGKKKKKKELNILFDFEGQDGLVVSRDV